MNFIKNKSVGYWIAVADAVLALVLGIIYFATYKTAIGNNAGGQIPETVGIFMFVGFAIELVLLALPQYGFINLIAIAMFGVSFFKEVYLYPDFIAGKANNVEYNGGDFGLNTLYIVMQLVILISAIVATFLGFYKKKEDENEDYKIKKSPLGIGKIAGGVVVIALAIVIGFVSTHAVQVKAEEELKEAQRLEKERLEREAEEERLRLEAKKFNPINDDVRAKADAVEYTFDPKSVLIKQKETWDYTNAALTATATRADHNLVYYFEGSYREGYQGDYSATYAHMYLWDDGLMIGKAGDTTFKGYWYNSSIQYGKDEDGKDIEDCLCMVTDNERYQFLNCDPSTGFYSKKTYLYLGFSWGTRSMTAFGFMYYPEVDIAIHFGEDNDHIFRVGDSFDKNKITVYRILKDLNFGAIFTNKTFTVTLPTGMLDSDGCLAAEGEYEIKATYNGFSTTRTLKVEAAL